MMENNKEIVFLTGGSGFLGSYAADLLVKEGYRVRCLVRKNSDRNFLRSVGVEFCEGDLDDRDALAQGLKNVSHVVHSAGLIKVKKMDEFFHVNHIGTKNLVETAAKINPALKRFVHISTIAAQGPCPANFVSTEGEKPENTPLERDPRLPPAPVSKYGTSKLLAENEVLKHASLIPVAIIRPPVIYGPRDREFFTVFKIVSRFRIIPVLRKSQFVSMIHVMDVARAILFCLRVSHESGSIFPVDDGKVYSYRDIGRIIGNAEGKKIRTLKIPLSALYFSGFVSYFMSKLSGRSQAFTQDKAREMAEPYWICGHRLITEKLGWQPENDFEKGSKETLQWYREKGWL
jgi:nucleoside-diphosphate-sugar epimerase